MFLSNLERSEFIRKILNEFRLRLETAIDNDMLDNFLELHGLELEQNPTYVFYNRKTKILVVGALAGNKKDYIMHAKKLGFCEYNFQFIEYSEIKTYDTDRFKNSLEFSDIICGPIPHKVKGLEDYDNLISKIKHNPQEYPKLFSAVEKLSVNKFKQGLLQTRLYQKLNEISC